MKDLIKKQLEKISPSCHDENGDNYGYVIFRLVVSSMFFIHGAQKFFGLFGGLDGAGHSVPFGGLLWFAGLIEVVAGILVFAGVFARLGASLAAIEMFVAYFMVHFPKGLNPLHNGGELALMYFVAFLVIIRYGAGKLSVEKKYCKSELF